MGIRLHALQLAAWLTIFSATAWAQEGAPGSTPITARTPPAGHGGGADFEEIRGDGWLVGLHLAYGDYSGHKIIQGVQPIFLTAAGKVLGAKCGSIDQPDAIVEAREGYAIAALDIKAGDLIDGLDVVFKRIASLTVLQPEEGYTSDWYGGKGGSNPTRIDAQGQAVAGIFGKAKKDSVGRLGLIYRSATPSPASARPAAATAPPKPPAMPSVPNHGGDLVQDYRSGLILVEGAQGRGSGFICNLQGHKLLVTNAHVLAGIQAPVFKLLDGTPIQVGQAGVAEGHDLAILGVSGSEKAFEVMDAVQAYAAIGDEVIVLGNSEGAGVIKPLTGKIVGIGPNQVEVDAEFLPGNSGSPIIHRRSGKVIGVATYLLTRNFDAKDGKTVRTEVHRYGYRLDTVQKWQPIVWSDFYAQAAQIEKVQVLTGDLVRFVEDLGSGTLHANLHQNPAIKPRVDAWLDVRRRAGVSGHDKDTADANLLSFLRLACKTDVTEARRRLTYDYFLRELDGEEKDRAQISEVFGKLVSLLR